MTNPITKEQLTGERIADILEMATDAAKRYGSQWDSALVGGVNGNFHAITSDTFQAVVVHAKYDSRDSSWLCDYLESVSPATMISVLQELQERRKGDNPELKIANLANKFYERYPLNTFKSDGERAEAFGYFMAGAELQCFGEFIKYEDLCGDE